MSGTLARILMSVDAVGGVWRYALDLSAALKTEVVLAGLGPPPSPAQRREAEAAGIELVWTEEPLDWMADGPGALGGVAARLAELAARYRVDLVHLNAPSQAAGLELPCPVVAVSHSCLPSWWAAVKGTALPEDWRWHAEANRAGFAAADLAISPSRSHAAALVRCYGPLDRLEVVPNATVPVAATVEKQPVVFAAGRWWDEGKNAALLDAAAARARWPVMMAGALVGPQGQRVTLDHARALGPLGAAEMAVRLAEAAIVASPSRYEPFGLVALEGAAAGAALVLADIPTYREIWEGAAIFAAPDDPAAFAAALDALAGDPDLCAELGRKAAARARGFSLKAQAAAMREAYRIATAHAAARQARAA